MSGTTDLGWFKSSYSGSQGDDCIEVTLIEDAVCEGLQACGWPTLRRGPRGMGAVHQAHRTRLSPGCEPSRTTACQSPSGRAGPHGAGPRPGAV